MRHLRLCCMGIQRKKQNANDAQSVASSTTVCCSLHFGLSTQLHCFNGLQHVLRPWQYNTLTYTPHL